MLGFVNYSGPDVLRLCWVRRRVVPQVTYHQHQPLGKGATDCSDTAIKDLARATIGQTSVCRGCR